MSKRLKPSRNKMINSGVGELVVLPDSVSFAALNIGEEYRHVEAIGLGLDEIRRKVSEAEYVAVSPIPSTHSYRISDPETRVVSTHVIPLIGKGKGGERMRAADPLANLEIVPMDSHESDIVPRRSRMRM